MRGGWLHNHVIVERLDVAFRAVGATTRLECATGPTRPRGFVDILATLGSVRVACEAELRADRVDVAVRKAVWLDVDYLVLVAPDHRTAHAIRARFDSLGADLGGVAPPEFILTLGQAIQWISHSFPFLTPRNAASPAKKEKAQR
jgi:hypothetical protein